MNKNAAKKGGTAKRLLSYVLKGYKFRFFLVLVCILVSAAASVSASLFLGSLIDDYIAPLLLRIAAHPDPHGLSLSGGRAVYAGL